jgi:hypothetical protein
MAKKSRRAKDRQRARAGKAVRERRPQQRRSMPAGLQSPAKVSPKAQDFTTHYSYVMPEIKRIGIIAGPIILTIIILSFVLG